MIKSKLFGFSRSLGRQIYCLEAVTGRKDGNKTRLLENIDRFAQWHENNENSWTGAWTECAKSRKWLIISFLPSLSQTLGRNRSEVGRIKKLWLFLQRTFHSFEWSSGRFGRAGYSRRSWRAKRTFEMLTCHTDWTGRNIEQMRGIRTDRKTWRKHLPI